MIGPEILGGPFSGPWWSRPADESKQGPGAGDGRGGGVCVRACGRVVGVCGGWPKLFVFCSLGPVATGASHLGDARVGRVVGEEGFSAEGEVTLSMTR
jgi:hypothetical protein